MTVKQQAEHDAVSTPASVPMITKLHRLLDDSAREWNLSSRAARWMFWSPVFGTLVVLASCAYRPLFTFLLDEDGLAEWLQFGLFAIACVSGVVIARQLTKSRNVFYASLFGLFAIGMFFCAGEEISWGQRVFDVETPEGLLEVNKQNETNLHNVGNTLTYMRLVMATGAVVGGTAWFINRSLRIERLVPNAEVLFIPPPFLMAAFLVMFCYRMIRYAFPNLTGFTIVHLAEWPELCFAFALSAFSFLIARRLTTEAAAASGNPAS
ncbi:MAG: hypothetical protein AB7O26_03910 [Planctomycetaceae bacterium]